MFYDIKEEFFIHLPLNRTVIKRWKQKTEQKEKDEEKNEVYLLRVPTPQKEYEHYVLHRGANRKKLWRQRDSGVIYLKWPNFKYTKKLYDDIKTKIMWTNGTE